MIVDQLDSPFFVLFAVAGNEWTFSFLIPEHKRATAHVNFFVCSAEMKKSLPKKKETNEASFQILFFFFLPPFLRIHVK